MTIAQVALPVAAHTVFDYWVPAGLNVAAGHTVRVRLGRRLLAGVVVAIGATSDVAAERLQPLREVIAAIPPLPPDILALAEFVARYYQQPLGLVLAQVLPPLAGGASRAPVAATAIALTEVGRSALAARLAADTPARALFEQIAAADGATLEATTVAALPARARAQLRRWLAREWVARVAAAAAPAGALPALNDDQREAAAAVIAAGPRFAPFMLQGVTGSGKTEVYLAAAAAAIASGGQALVLVPEINLTPQLAQRIAAALPGRTLALLHSRLAAGERRRAFCAAARGDADLVLGTRLAVFVPLPRLALVVVDEEHDASFKQEDGVRYHARDVATWRAHQRGVPVVLGSATPSLETLLQAQRGRYASLRLRRRAVEPARPPLLHFAPARGPDMIEGLGGPLVAAVATRLARGEQSLIFINRRGYSPSLLCAACGWHAGCPRCSVRLVVHRSEQALRCHHCAHEEPLPRACPDCGNVDLLPAGHGTQRLADALAARFPAARIVRVDRDTTQRKGAFAAMRDSVQAGEVDILVGTQMLAKGHDFPRLTLVGVLGADNALYSADFRATERAAALLFQVAGRAGRAQLPGEVIVQTDFPGHPLYRALADDDYDGFAATVLAERQDTGLPPFGHLALLGAEAHDRRTVDAFLAAAHAAGEAVVKAAKVAVDVFPPAPASLARRAGLERGQVLAQSAMRAPLQRFLPAWREALEQLPGRRVRWALDVDPAGFG
jgi:primosomal protein N' (replication factor Y)